MFAVLRPLAGAVAGLAAASLASLGFAAPAAPPVHHHHHHHAAPPPSPGRRHHVFHHHTFHHHVIHHRHSAVPAHRHGTRRHPVIVERAANPAIPHGHRHLHHRPRAHLPAGPAEVAASAPRHARLCQQVMIHGHWTEKCR